MLRRESNTYRNTAAGGFEWENNDCVIRAFCVLTRKPYAEIHALAKACGRKDKHGTSDKTIRAMADKLGLLIRVYGERFKRTRTGKLTFDFPTLAQHLKNVPGLDCVLVRRGHAFAYTDGIVRDWDTGTGARSRIWYYIYNPKQAEEI